MDDQGVRFRRFNIIDEHGNLRKGSVTAAIKEEGTDSEGCYVYSVQFSYASPKEHQENRKVGQSIALMRLMSDDSARGKLFICLTEKYKGLTRLIKETIMMEAARKRITWMQGLTEANLV